MYDAKTKQHVAYTDSVDTATCTDGAGESGAVGETAAAWSAYRDGTVETIPLTSVLQHANDEARVLFYEKICVVELEEKESSSDSGTAASATRSPHQKRKRSGAGAAGCNKPPLKKCNSL